MSKNKEMIIAGVDADTWLEAESKSIKVVEKSRKKYDKKIVAFLDLLAMKDLILIKKIRPGEEEEAFETIEQIKGIVEKETESLETDHDFYLLQISDSFIFTCSENDILKLIALLAKIQMRILIECQFQLRGAITYGDVYVADEGKQIIGPAYIYAYLLQENNAIYPRIILDNSFINRFNELKQDARGMTLSVDTETCVDYLSVFMQSENKNLTDIITYLKREKVFTYLVSQYKEFNEKNNHSVKQKYGWTIQYFKSKGVWPNDKQYNNW
jgi:hypothetical protein